MSQQCYTCQNSVPDSQLLVRVLPGMHPAYCVACARNAGVRAILLSEIENAKSAPWAGHQLASLAAYQKSPTYLPFVCSQDHTLQAREDGLACSICLTVQTWTYDWTLNWSWKLLEPPESDAVPARKSPTDPYGETAASLEEPDGEAE